MEKETAKVAAAANAAYYDSDATREYIDGAPHIKHARLRELYGSMVVDIYGRLSSRIEHPRVLDLGAGQGSVTIPFLELGARVTAVDISESQLASLEDRCREHSARLDCVLRDLSEIIDEYTEKGEQFDLVVVNSLLHHIPDYIELIERASALIAPGGMFFSFQDPMRYDRLGRWPWMFTRVSYLSWRVFKGDVLGGIGRTIRRRRGVYLEDSTADNAEYHVVRNGVDEAAIVRHLSARGFDCDLTTYFSTQSTPWQHLGTWFGIRNTFAVVARRPLDVSPSGS